MRRCWSSSRKERSNRRVSTDVVRWEQDNGVMHGSFLIKYSIVSVPILEVVTDFSHTSHVHFFNQRANNDEHGGDHQIAEKQLVILIHDHDNDGLAGMATVTKSEASQAAFSPNKGLVSPQHETTTTVAGLMKGLL